MPSSPLRLVRITLLAALALALAPAVAAAAPATGVNTVFPGPGVASLIAPLNVSYVREFVRWDEIETAPGVYDQGRLGYTDQSIESFPAGTKVIVDLSGTPGWAQNGGGDQRGPASDPQSYARFIHFLAARYRGYVAAWEVWNEEDVSGWYTGSPQNYTAMLQAAYPAVKSADPSATVLVGGLTGNDYHYLEQLYADGAAGSFDGVAVHTDTACNITSPYSYFRDADGRIDQFSFLGYREVHNVMASHGDGAKSIWMTEFGWNTTSSICTMGRWAGQKAGGVSETDQGVFMRQALHCVAADPYVAAMVWFQLQDAGREDTSEQRYGLLRYNGTRKPAYQTFARYNLLGDTLHDTCGNFTGPKIALLRPKAGKRYSGPLLIRVSATSSYGVARITIYDDGKRIRNFTSRRHPQTLTGRIRWQGAKHLARGKHVISALAIDPMGNSTTTSATVFRK